MAYNRQSGVSSFYGDRRSSVDALNQDFSQPPPTSRGRYESNATSFYNAAGPSQRSTEMLRPQSAGYNRMSYLDAGRVEPVKGGYEDEEYQKENEGGWDVFADFNNAGPRYSSAFGAPQTKSRYVEPSTTQCIFIHFIIMKMKLPSSTSFTSQQT